MGGGNRYPQNYSVRSRADGRREFFQHDDRGYANQNKSRLRFGPGESGEGQHWRGQSNSGYSRSFRRGQRGRGGGTGSGSYKGRFGQKPTDGDIQMREEGKGRFQDYYESSRGGRRGRRPFRGGSAKIFTNSSSWIKITIHNTQLNVKDEVMELIKGNVNDVFTPVLIGEEGSNLVFFLEKQAHIARAILTLSNRLTLRDGRQLRISYRESLPFVAPPTDQQIEVITRIMSDRYSIELKRLDLKNFHNDPSLIKEQIFCPLFRHVSLVAVIEVITRHIPDVEEIDFSNNQLNTVNELEMLRDCEHLNKLNLDNNRLRFIDNLMKIKCLQLEEISLTGNPLREKFHDNKTYRTSVSRLFPKARILDGIEVERPIGFAVEADAAKMPKVKGSFFCNEEAKTIVLKFIEQYYQVFESASRRPLEAAYTEDALFSLSANFPEFGNSSKYSKIFMEENRNLKVIPTNERKHRLLAKGRVDVVDAICRLPVVLHDPNSFIIDIPLVQARLIHVVLMGVFKQVVDAQSPIRSFMRSLIIVPVGSGFCISNEELFVNAATVEQIRKSFKVPVDRRLTSPDSSMAQEKPGPSTDKTLDAHHLALITQFAATSKMLPEYCRMCLEQNQWDFSKAGEMFLSLQNEKKIPPEYFGSSA